MKLKFYGAAREVTGSRHLLEVNGKKILLDCGMFQGNRKEAEHKNKVFGFTPNEVDAVCLSHAHIDHSGSLPRIVKEGFKGPIYCTFSTQDLCKYMLMDSAFIQEKDAEYVNKKKIQKAEKAGITPELVEPNYTAADAAAALSQFHAIGYEKTTEIFPGVKLTLYNSGHILGSALSYFEIHDQDDGKTKTLLYTGDLGRKNLPILKNPHQIESVENLIIEATYGNRLHEAITDIENKLADIVNTTIGRGGKIIIPAFALERTQEIVYTLHRLSDQKRIPEALPIIVDSPLSGNLTEVFKAHTEDFDQEAHDEFLKHGDNPFGFGQLRYTKNVDESKALNMNRMPMIIISASGMCENGRVLHHLKNNISDPKNTILIVGFMAKSTLGRKIIEKNSVVNIFGEPYSLRAQVEVIDAFSGHADRSDLIEYVTRIKGLKKTFLVHAEETQAESLKTFLGENGVQDVIIPHNGDEVTL